MREYYIEDIRSDALNGGTLGFAAGAVKFTEDDESQWLSAVDMDGVPNVYLSDECIFDELMENPGDETLERSNRYYITEFNDIDVTDYEEAYRCMEQDPDNPAVPLIKLLIALLRSDWDDAGKLADAASGRYADEVDIPMTDIEEEMSDEYDDEAEDDSYDDRDDDL